MAAPVRAHTPIEEMAEAATNLLAALNPEQRAKATFPVDDPERVNWHFIPRARKGLPLKEMSVTQRHLAQALLASGLSTRGFIKASTIMSLEEILKDIEQGKGPVRDPELYYFSLFGPPAADSTWGWRVEGHHLSVNFTIVKGQEVSTSPSFFGSNPGEVRQGPRQGLRVLGREEDLGRELVKSLNESQRNRAVITNKAPADIVTSNARRATPLAPAGLAAVDLTAPQKELLLTLIREYALRLRPELAESDLRKLNEAGLDKVGFAWAGGLERGQPHYYRVQGPTFLLEYDNTQNDANHIHTVWRDFENDFGDDLLRRHYETSPHHTK